MGARQMDVHVSVNGDGVVVCVAGLARGLAAIGGLVSRWRPAEESGNGGGSRAGRERERERE